MSSEIGEHVEVTTTENSVGPSRAGFGTQAIFDCYYATFPERSREYSDISEMPDDGMTSKTPAYRAAQKAFAQRPRPRTVKVIRGDGKPTLKYRIDTQTAPSVGQKFELYIEGDSASIEDTTVTYTTKADIDFVDADVTTGSDTIAEASHGMTTGDGPYRVKNSGGALPTGLAADTDYWIIAPTSGTFKLASSKANAIALTAVDITAAAGGGTHTLVRNANDVVMAQFKQGVNAITSKNFTATQQAGVGDTDYLEIVGDTAGVWFSVEVNSIKRLKIAVTHAEPATTLATDLDEIEEEDPDWYGLTYPYPSDACIKAAADWIEGKSKILIATMSDSDIATTAESAGDGDTANDLKNLELARTAVVYHPNPAAFAGAAWMGRCLSTEPGRATWKFKALRTVANVVLTTTQRSNLRDKNANSYTQTARNLNQMWEGKTADGDFIDVTRNIDWLDDAMQTAVMGAFDANDIVPMTEAGKQIVLNEVEGTLSEAVTRGILSNDADDTPVVTAPLISEISEQDRADRILPDIAWDGRLAGAIHKAKIRGNVRV